MKRQTGAKTLKAPKIPARVVGAVSAAPMISAVPRRGPTEDKPKAKPETKSTVRPPVSATRFQMRHTLILVSLVVCVLIPGALTASYLWGRAADQFVSRVGFAVRHEDQNSALEFLSGLSSASGASSSDTDILFEFLQSQELVADINQELDLRAIWSLPENDPYFSFDQSGTIEDLVAYWNRMVKLSYGAGSGLLQVEVRAFKAEDATTISQTLLDKSSEMINQLSAIARQDAIRYSREELDTTLERVKEARTTLTRFRNENQLINPELDLNSQAGLLGNLHTQQATALIEIDLLSGSTQPDDPRLKQAMKRLEVIENRIEEERRKVGFGGEGGTETAFADLVGEYETLEVEREFAERAYTTALAAYDGALADSRRKNRYLAAYMAPTKAERAEYPERLTLLALVTLFLFLVWSVGALVFYSIKDRR